MPGPFPGMDPYLENPRRWADVHHRLISALAAILTPLLPDTFFASIQERLYIAEAWADFRSDVAVVPIGGTLIPVTVSTTEEVREPFIEIIALDEGERVVTNIEVLSPKNKLPGAGRVQYERKQRRLEESDIHLLEIDLLRAGTHTVAAHEDLLRAGGLTWDYIVSLHRAGAGAQFEAWPRNIRQPLPVVHVPLAGGFADVPLDVQAALTYAYDEGRSGRILDYRREPDPPLSPAEAAWADTLLREKGLRA